MLAKLAARKADVLCFAHEHSRQLTDAQLLCGNSTEHAKSPSTPNFLDSFTRQPTLTGKLINIMMSGAMIALDHRVVTIYKNVILLLLHYRANSCSLLSTVLCLALCVK